MANIQQGFPQLATPIADMSNQGRVTQPWQQFFISLWNRTGAQQGNATFDAGDLKGIAGASIPAGWLLCDGSAVSRTQYAGLFSAIGVLWGAGDNISTFNLPELRGRSPIGASTLIPLGSIGGTNEVTLSVPNLPAHSHPITDAGHVHSATIVTANGTSGTDSVGATSANTGLATTGITATDNAGNGQPFSILPPYAAIQWIIKI